MLIVQNDIIHSFVQWNGLAQGTVWLIPDVKGDDADDNI